MPPLLRRVLPALLLLGVVVALEFRFGGERILFERIISDTAWRQLALFAMVNVIVALSLNVINGMAGQFSIGHAGFVGIGAYTGAVIASQMHMWLFLSGKSEGTPRFDNSFLVMPVVLIASGLVAGLFGFLVGLPSLRLKGDYLAIVTLGFAEIFRLVIATAQTGGGAQGGLSGMLASLGGQNGYGGPDIPRQTEAIRRQLEAAQAACTAGRAEVCGAAESLQRTLDRLALYDGGGVPQYAGPFWILGAVFVCTILAWRLKFSGWGRALRALREDEIASAAVGVDPTRYKVTSFVIAAVGAGMAGALLSSMRDGSPTVQPDQFTFTYSFDAITMVILGGSGSVSGAIVGGVFVTFTVKMIEQLQGIDAIQALKAEYPSLDLNALRMVVYAAVLIGLMILRPEGLFGERELFRRGKKQAKGGSRLPPGASAEVPPPAKGDAASAAGASNR